MPKHPGTGHSVYLPTGDRRFPPPCVEELEACFVVTDSAGQKLAYVYFEDDRFADRRQSCSAKMRRDP
jgi:hypothetical protein